MGHQWLECSLPREHFFIFMQCVRACTLSRGPLIDEKIPAWRAISVMRITTKVGYRSLPANKFRQAVCTKKGR